MSARLVSSLFGDSASRLNGHLLAAILIAALAFLYPHLLMAESAKAIKVAVQVVPHEMEGQRCADQLIVRATRVSGQNDADNEIVETQINPEWQGVLSLSVGEIWTVELLQCACWAPSQTINADDLDGTLRIPAWPAATLIADLVPPEGAYTRPPSSDQAPAKRPGLQVHVRDLSDETSDHWSGDRLLELNDSCTLEGNQARCTIPATGLDARLVVEGYAASYLWDLHPSPGEKIQARPVKLIRGGSLVGWVTIKGSSSIPDSVGAHLEPAVLGELPSGSTRRLELQSLSAPVSSRGFFQITGIRPGRYVLVVTGGSRHSTLRHEPVQIEADQESVIERPLLLEERASLEVVVTPAVDALGHWWTAVLMRRVDGSRALVDRRELPVSLGGYVRFDQLEHGEYWLFIHNTSGDTLARRQIMVDPDLLPIDLDLPIVQIAGSVMIGDRGVPAELELRTDDGGRVAFETDEHGIFAGSIPHGGMWRIKLSGGPFGRGGRRLEPREIVREPDGSPTPLEISLADTDLTGIVVDETGQPVTEATVTAYRRGAVACEAWVDSNGSFSILGLDQGPVTLQALALGLESDYVEAHVTEKEQEKPVRIVIRQTEDIVGLVRSPAGPVPGALVRYWVPGTYTNGRVTSGPSGRFELELLASIRALDVTVLAPGFPAKLDRITISPDGELDLPVGFEPAGTLTVRLAQTLRIGHNGASVPFWGLFEPGTMGMPPGVDVTTGTFSVQIEPGLYEACSQSEEGMRACDTGQVLPGGALSLDSRGPDSATQHRGGDLEADGEIHGSTEI